MLESPATAARPEPRIAGRSPRTLKLAIGGLVIALALVYLLLTALQTAVVYYVTAGELTAQGEAAYGRLVRLGGRVVDDSIERDDRALTLRFALSDGTASVPVTYRGIVPDLFGYARDGYYQDVVVEGRYSRAGVLEANQLIVSHGAVMEAGSRAGTGPPPGVGPPAERSDGR